MPEECVQVIIRLRPMSSTEKKNNNTKIVQMDTSRGTVSVQQPNAQEEVPKSWTFDAVFDDSTQQQDFFDKTATRIVNSVIDGYNGTIFAYGQTGTGKTFSMEGGKTKELRGVIPRAFEQVFSHIEVSEGMEFLVRASFIEIYNEDVFDLLSGKERRKLELKEDPDKGVYVKDLGWYVVKDVDQCDQILQEGKSNRQVGATAMNADSSRSHCIFTLKIETSAPREETGEMHIKAGKLNMVDLAGSERQTKTEATGDRLKEATKINLSLSALGNVISALTSKKRGASHIPYRDSKLTRLLQDSLGGNTKTVMIAALGPADYNYDETISTLRFANRAKSIKNKPKINEDPKDAMLREYQEEIARLKAALAADGDIPPELLAALEGGAGGGMGRKVVVERVVTKVVQKGVSKDKMKELEEQAAEKKRAIEERAEREKQEILEMKRQMEEKAMETGQQLEITAAELQAKVQQKNLLADKLKEMEQQLVHGNTIIDNAAKQKLLIKKKEAELRKKQLEAERINRELEERREVEEQMQEKYESQDKELAAKTKKLDKLRMKYQEIKTEIEDVQAENQREREELLETIRELTRQIELKKIIIENFVPFAVGSKMESRAFWDEDKEQWLLEEIDPKTEHAMFPQPGSGKPNQPRPISEFARIKAALGDQNPRFKSENIIQLELDMPDRTTQDYEDLRFQIQDQYHQQDQAMYMEEEDRMHNQMVQAQMLQEQMMREQMMGGNYGVQPGGGQYYGQYDSQSGDFSDESFGRPARRM